MKTTHVSRRWKFGIAALTASLGASAGTVALSDPVKVSP